MREHKLNYSSLLFSALLFAPDPRRVLVIGLGAGVVPREMVFHLRLAQVDVIELDPEILNVATKFFKFKEGSRLKVIIGDAREVVTGMQAAGHEPYDIIILDAFQGDYIPDSLVTVEFLSAVRSLLSETGVVAANMFNTHDWFGSQVRTFGNAFGERLYALHGTRAPATTILFAAGIATGQPEPAGLRSPSSIAARLGLSFDLRMPSRLSARDAARVLRDADLQLMAQ